MDDMNRSGFFERSPIGVGSLLDDAARLSGRVLNV
jgi:hypothetical protein